MTSLGARTPLDTPEEDKKLGADISDRAHQMARGAAILYRNKKSKNEASPHYRGITKLHNGDVYWLALWVRSLRGDAVLEIKLIPKTEA
jgi:hypothetical protein